MRTNIVLDDELLQEAFRYANVSTKKEIVHLALKEFVENAKKLSLLDLKGQISFDDEYDYKAMRNNRVFS
jgi:Arc/MetJ family transcription regulator